MSARSYSSTLLLRSYTTIDSILTSGSTFAPEAGKEAKAAPPFEPQPLAPPLLGAPPRLGASPLPLAAAAEGVAAGGAEPRSGSRACVSGRAVAAPRARRSSAWSVPQIAET